MPARRPVVVLFSAAETLSDLDRPLAVRKVRLIRIPILEAVPVDPARWLPRLREYSGVDTAVVTSRSGVRFGARPWLRTRRGSLGPLEFWAVGPVTAKACRAIGTRAPRVPRDLGARALRRALQRRRPRTIVYFRSEQAGPLLGRELRISGHRVRDPVVYRTRPRTRLTRRETSQSVAAKVWVVASPSALRAAERALGRTVVGRLRPRIRVVTLGEKSKAAARARGYAHVSVASPSTAQAFTRHLLGELRNAEA